MPVSPSLVAASVHEILSVHGDAVYDAEAVRVADYLTSGATNCVTFARAVGHDLLKLYSQTNEGQEPYIIARSGRLFHAGVVIPEESGTAIHMLDMTVCAPRHQVFTVSRQLRARMRDPQPALQVHIDEDDGRMQLYDLTNHYQEPWFVLPYETGNAALKTIVNLDRSGYTSEELASTIQSLLSQGAHG